MFKNIRKLYVQLTGSVPINWVERRYDYGKRHYGDVNVGKSNRLKKKIQARILSSRPVKPRVRVKLYTFITTGEGNRHRKTVWAGAITPPSGMRRRYFFPVQKRAT
jgi:hypothetical protein